MHCQEPLPIITIIGVIRWDEIRSADVAQLACDRLAYPICMLYEKRSSVLIVLQFETAASVIRAARDMSLSCGSQDSPGLLETYSTIKIAVSELLT